MAQFDLPLAELEKYLPARHEPADFESFWLETLAVAWAKATPTTVETLETGLKQLVVKDLTFSGFNGDPIKAWLIHPHVAPGQKLPTIVSYVGYGGGRGRPLEHTLFPSAGYAQLIMDTRGQGSGWSVGHTADPYPTGPHASGMMTKGIESPQDYYYRRVFTDAVRLLGALRELEVIDTERVILNGGSQGGGIALAAAGLVGLLNSVTDAPGVSGADVAQILGVAADVPFLQHIRHATTMTDAFPYGEIVQYLHTHRGAEEMVFNTLNYFDGVNFTPRASVPALYSVALMDGTCPPSTVYASFNYYGGADKTIEIYPYNQHEGGQVFQTEKQLAFFSRISGA